MTFAPTYVPPVQLPRRIHLRPRLTAATRRIRVALLTGPLALMGQKFERTLLVERCEDIPGADHTTVRSTLRSLIEAGLVHTDGENYWRAA